MYAVIRAGGKQYRVSPGDVIKIERTPDASGRVEFNDIVAVSASEGQIGRPGSASVIGEVVAEGRADKILVFKFKRKKQYKKMQGHRQGFTQVRISEINVDGQKFSAPELPKKQKRVRPEATAEQIETRKSAPKHKAAAPKKAAKKSAPKKSAAKKSAAKSSKKK